jgi:hypothetical protein
MEREGGVILLAEAFVCAWSGGGGTFIEGAAIKRPCAYFVNRLKAHRLLNLPSRKKDPPSPLPTAADTVPRERGGCDRPQPIAPQRNNSKLGVQGGHPPPPRTPSSRRVGGSSRGHGVKFAKFDGRVNVRAGGGSPAVSPQAGPPSPPLSHPPPSRTSTPRQQTKLGLPPRRAVPQALSDRPPPPSALPPRSPHSARAGFDPPTQTARTGPLIRGHGRALEHPGPLFVHDPPQGRLL